MPTLNHTSQMPSPHGRVPCDETSALVITGDLCACITASCMQKDGTMPKEDEQRFLTDPEAFLTDSRFQRTAYDKAGNSYRDESKLGEILERTAIPHAHFPDFTGEISYLSIRGITMHHEHKSLYCLIPEPRRESPAMTSEDLEELEKGYRDILKDCIPNDFDLKIYVGDISGTYET